RISGAADRGHPRAAADHRGNGAVPGIRRADRPGAGVVQPSPGTSPIGHIVRDCPHWTGNSRRGRITIVPIDGSVSRWRCQTRFHERSRSGRNDLMDVDDLCSLSIFEGLSRDQLAELIAAGTEVRIEPGVDMWREGELADFWWVLVDGALDLVRRVGREEAV